MSAIFRYTTLLILISIGCAITGCMTVPRVNTPLFEGQQGTISLRVFADPLQKAQHPITLEPHIIRRILNGLYVQEIQTVLKSALMTNNPPDRAFTQEEIRFLTPHLVAGLAKATPEEEVVFRLHSRQSPNIQYTTGSLYCSGSTIHVLIHGYHQGTKKPPLLSRPSNSFTRSKLWEMSFRPSRALTSDSLDANPQTSFPVHFAIHLSRLTQTRKNPAPPISPTSPSVHEELEELRESLQQQHRQIDRLENQLQTDNPAQP